MPTLIECINARPPLLSTYDLIDLGVVSSYGAARMQRSRGIGPKFIHLSKNRIVYPREAVFQFLMDQGLVFPENKKPEVSRE